MATNSKTSRASGRRGGRSKNAAGAGAPRATRKPRKAAAVVRSAGKPDETTRGAKRICQAPGCGKTFRAYVDRQRFCSNGCRSRAFYWDFKDKTGERYAAHLSGDGASRRKPVRRSLRVRGRTRSRNA
jgi:hypothetical protein